MKALTDCHSICQIWLWHPYITIRNLISALAFAVCLPNHSSSFITSEKKLEKVLGKIYPYWKCDKIQKCMGHDSMIQKYFRSVVEMATTFTTLESRLMSIGTEARFSYSTLTRMSNWLKMFVMRISTGTVWVRDSYDISVHWKCLQAPRV